MHPHKEIEKKNGQKVFVHGAVAVVAAAFFFRYIENI